ncbi:MAG: ABC transporter permease [Oscillospiraceae bacterium]|nr:ABC transporter permease [Oscillospiraceae bacterium]
MGRYILKRLLWLIPVMLVISLIAFLLMYLSPGDPATIYLSMGGDSPSAEAVAELREKMGLNRPLYEQFGSWLINLLHGDLGTSFFTKNPVIEDIATLFPNTLKLTLLGMLGTLVISIPLGILSAVKANKLTDNIIRAGSFVVGSMPGFFAALLLIYLLGVKLRWLPTISSGSAKGIILPALTLALTMAPNYIRQIRAEIVKELGEDYIRMFRGRGIKERMILYNGALKSVMPSILTIAGMNMGHLLGGTSIIEMVCTYQGLGRLAVNSITNRDYPLMQGFVLMMAGIYVIINLVVDILHAMADPRVKLRILAENGGGYRHGKKKAV